MFLPMRTLVDLHAFIELAGARPRKGKANTVPVRGVHIGLDLEYEAAEFVFFG